jgi:formylglycine-generating enzyme required for sulfatase activity
MVYIAGDTFTMGKSGPQEKVYGPVENIVVGNYWICNTEVTQGLWESVMDTVWAEVVSNSNYGVGSNFPVYYVSWYDAVIFCNRLSVLCGMNPVYGDSGMDDSHKQAITAMGYSAPKMDYSASITNVEIDYTANGFRLPTEVEWEYAARGGAGVGTHYAGTDIDNVSSDINVGGLGAYAWYSGNAQSKTHEAGTKLPNILGLFDMSGNVWEWCNDWYQSGSAGVGDNPVDGVGPTGASAGSYRVYRGGSWGNAAVYSRVAYRRGNAAPSNRYSNLGFRLAVSSAL